MGIRDSDHGRRAVSEAVMRAAAAIATARLRILFAIPFVLAIGGGKRP
jgi:hypothetical protein